MAKDGTKTGGRKKGTPNKRTLDFVENLGNYDPLESLLRIVQDETTPLDTRIKINLDLLPYLYPRRKAVQFDETNVQMPKIVVRFNGKEKDIDEYHI